MKSGQSGLQTWPGDRPPSADAVERRMIEENIPYLRWWNGPAAVYGAHHHPYRKVIYVVQGSITFGLPEEGRQIFLSAGDRFDLPPGVVHDAVVGPLGVICLEGHTD